MDLAATHKITGSVLRQKSSSKSYVGASVHGHLTRVGRRRIDRQTFIRSAGWTGKVQGHAAVPFDSAVIQDDRNTVAREVGATVQYKIAIDTIGAGLQRCDTCWREGSSEIARA